MKSNRIADLFRRERDLSRAIRRKEEWYHELVETAISTGAFRYETTPKSDSSPAGSRHERLVIKYNEIEEEIDMLKAERDKVTEQIVVLISKLPPRERRVMKARHVDHDTVESIMKRFGLTYQTYKQYHSQAMKRMELNLDNIYQT